MPRLLIALLVFVIPIVPAAARPANRITSLEHAYVPGYQRDCYKFVPPLPLVLGDPLPSLRGIAPDGSSFATLQLDGPLLLCWISPASAATSAQARKAPLKDPPTQFLQTFLRMSARQPGCLQIALIAPDPSVMESYGALFLEDPAARPAVIIDPDLQLPQLEQDTLVYVDCDGIVQAIDPIADWRNSVVVEDLAVFPHPFDRTRPLDLCDCDKLRERVKQRLDNATR